MISKIFGENCKRANVFDLFLSHPHSEYTKRDISDCAEIARGTLDTFIDELVEIGILKTTATIGKFQLYQINMDSPITQALNSFQNQLADIEIEKQLIEYEKTHNTEIKIKKPFEEIVKIEMEKDANRIKKYLNLFHDKTNELIITQINETSESELINYNVGETGTQVPVLIETSMSETNIINVIE